MKYDPYDIEIGLTSMTFQFVSEGQKGSITKRVEYSATAKPNIFILSFGDVDANKDYSSFSVKRKKILSRRHPIF